MYVVYMLASSTALITEQLSATMLTDTMEKSKNPLKRAMRRRNAKQVSFTEPTFVEPSDYGYSTEEEEDDDGSNPFTHGEQMDEETIRNGSMGEDGDQDDIAVVQPLSIKSVAATDQQPGSPEKEAPDDLDDEDRKYAVDNARASDDSDRGTYQSLVRGFSSDNTQSALVALEMARCEIQIRSSRMIRWKLGKSPLLLTSFATIQLSTDGPRSTSRKEDRALRALRGLNE
jgi:hypothetical protein